MPEWMHSRAKHIMAKNPEMPESQAFAIATQQMHALGKSPKGYGTAKGKHEAKAKYDTPKDDTKTADPGHIGEKLAELSGNGSSYLAPFLGSFSDELQKIANISAIMKPEATIKSKPYTQVNSVVPNAGLGNTKGPTNSAGAKPSAVPEAQQSPAASVANTLQAPPTRR